MTTVTAARSFLPYGKQTVRPEDIDAVTKVLRSDWWTQGPMAGQFEATLADAVGASEAVVCSNGTAALHLTMLALGIGPRDVVLTSANSFLASANCARYVGADVCFADIDPRTGLIDPDQVEKIFKEDTDRKIKAIIPVHFAGQPVDLPRLHRAARAHGAFVVSDGCHALGASYEHESQTCRIGCSAHSDATVFSFHPVKHVATGEGGAITTDNKQLAERLRMFGNHGIQKDSFLNTDMSRDSSGEINPWYYEMQNPGYNYRMTDLQAALGISQMKHLRWSVDRRNELADLYRELIKNSFAPEIVSPLAQAPDVTNAYHLFVVLIDFEQLRIDRARVMRKLREKGIGTQVHYIPICLQPYYRNLYNLKPGDLPGTDEYYAKALSLPMYPDLTNEDCKYVVEQLYRILIDNRGES